MGISDHYPVGMSFCDQSGLDGNCGLTCIRFLVGDCPIESDVIDSITDEVYGKIVYEVMDDELRNRIESSILSREYAVQNDSSS